MEQLQTAMRQLRDEFEHKLKNAKTELDSKTDMQQSELDKLPKFASDIASADAKLGGDSLEIVGARWTCSASNSRERGRQPVTPQQSP